MRVMRRTLLMGVTALLFSLGACTRSGSERPYKMIGSSPDAVQAAFNAAMGRVRVLMLVSPTCGLCLEGAADVTEQLAKLEYGRETRVYVVWVPRLNAVEKNVPAATRVVAASWAQQYWDPDDLLGQQYKQVLGWNENAWDVYMVYGPQVQWKRNLPPPPEFYMHQTSEKGPRLDAQVFASRVEQLLGR
jgi:hypothetical protein